MGTNQFQSEYIEYLQERNTELLNKLDHLKENYQNKILAKELNKHYLISTLKNVANVCTAISQEIDLFFDKMTVAMEAFKNILLRKSEMLQLMGKISEIVTPAENINNDLIAVEDSDVFNDQNLEDRVRRTAGTAKVSPMINGHIISTEPRIYLSRVPGIFTPSRKNETHQLSPIIEASPDASSDPSNLGSYVFREIKIPLERLNLNKMSYNYINEESPKSRFKGPKTWKKSLSSNKRQSDQQKNSVFSENTENLNKKFSVGEKELPHLSENVDPLEGPSWLHEEIPEMNSSSSRFIDYRRRKHRFATVFDKNEDCITYFEKPKKSLGEDSNDFYENHNDENDENDEKDLKENKKRVSESSEDYISESFSSECENNNLNKKRKFLKKRVGTTESQSENDGELINDNSLKKVPVVQLKNKNRINTDKSPIQSSDDENNEENLFRQPKEDKSNLLKKSLKRSMDFSFERTSNRAGHINKEIRISKRNKSKGREEVLSKDITKDVIIKLENCKSAKKFTPKKSKSRSPSVKKKSKKSRSKSKSKSPVDILSEYEGRQKRKAAPSFKLVEPKLKTKLRRN